MGMGGLINVWLDGLVWMDYLDCLGFVGRFDQRLVGMIGMVGNVGVLDCWRV
jgi:hypothetical protein